MSAIFSRPKSPAAPTPPGKSSAEIAQARADERRRLANARGRQSTLLGGSVGDNKNLLGQ